MFKNENENLKSMFKNEILYSPSLDVFLLCFTNTCFFCLVLFLTGKNFNLVANFLKRHMNLRCTAKQLHGGTQPAYFDKSIPSKMNQK